MGNGLGGSGTIRPSLQKVQPASYYSGPRPLPAPFQSSARDPAGFDLAQDWPRPGPTKPARGPARLGLAGESGRARPDPARYMFYFLNIYLLKKYGQEDLNSKSSKYNLNPLLLSYNIIFDLYFVKIYININYFLLYNLCNNMIYSFIL